MSEICLKTNKILFLIKDLLINDDFWDTLYIRIYWKNIAVDPETGSQILIYDLEENGQNMK